jgi:hypothetical protein
MIDRIARNQLALAIRRLGSGRLPFDSFCETAESIERSCDPADNLTREMAEWWYEFVMIGLDDMWTDDFDAFRGAYRMTSSGRRFIARHVLLLKSDATRAINDLTERKPLNHRPAPSLLRRVAEFDVCGARGTRYWQLRHLRTMGALRRIAPFSSTHEFHTARSRRIFFVGSTSASSAASN